MGIRTVFVFGSAGIEKAKSVGTNICGHSGVNLQLPNLPEQSFKSSVTKSAGTVLQSVKPNLPVLGWPLDHPVLRFRSVGTNISSAGRLRQRSLGA